MINKVTIRQLKLVTATQARDIDALMKQLVPRYPRTATEVLIAAVATTPGNALLVAQTEQFRIVGVLLLTRLAAITGDKVWIEDFVVDVEYRGQGIGRSLLKEAISYARARGTTHINLTAQPERSAARLLYESAGFHRHNTDYYRLTLVVPGSSAA